MFNYFFTGDEYSQQNLHYYEAVILWLFAINDRLFEVILN